MGVLWNDSRTTTVEKTVATTEVAGPLASRAAIVITKLMS
jgi:hypothetical protein